MQRQDDLLTLFTPPAASSAFTPPAMPTGLYADYMANLGSQTGAGVASTNNTPTDSWADQAGAFTATQSTTADMPTWLTGQFTAAQSGYDVGQSFDGTDDYLTHAAMSLGTASTIFVTLIPSVTGGGVVHGSASDYMIDLINISAGGSGQIKTSIGGSTTSSLASAAIALNKTVTIGIIRNGATVQWSVNTTAIASLGSGGIAAAAAYAPTTIGALAGGVAPGNIIIARMSLYARAVNSADFAQGMTTHQAIYHAW